VSLQLQGLQGQQGGVPIECQGERSVFEPDAPPQPSQHTTYDGHKPLPPTHLEKVWSDRHAGGCGGGGGLLTEVDALQRGRNQSVVGSTHLVSGVSSTVGFSRAATANSRSAISMLAAICQRGWMVLGLGNRCTCTWGPSKRAQRMSTTESQSYNVRGVCCGHTDG
jgi:hypothetical protein